MDFARKQLLKYGWTDGKGLGKHENGISEALKPKLKRSVAGVGYDAASDFTEHWWSQLYDKAAGNVQVEETNGKTKKIKTKDSDGFEITNSTWKLNRKKKGNDDGEYCEHFVRKSILTSGGSKVEKLAESDSEEEVGKKDVFKMSDEELFAACGGRTAHKGARHGLKALGKLARIAQQEQVLLQQPQYQGYSHAERLKKSKEIVEDTNMNSDVDEPIRKKKKKRKRCTSLNSTGICEEVSNTNEDLAVSQKISLPDEESMRQTESVASKVDEEKISRKKKSKSKDEEMVDLSENNEKKSKKKKRKEVEQMEVELSDEKLEPEEKKRKEVEQMEVELSDEKLEPEVKKRKKKKHKSMEE